MAGLRLPWVTLLGWLLGSLLVGGLTEFVGRQAAAPVGPEPYVLECLGFPAEGLRKSTSHVQLRAPAREPVSVDIDFLDVDSSILKSRHEDIRAGGQSEFQLPTWQMGLAVQIISTLPISVTVTLVYDGSIGPPERRGVPCKPHPSAVRFGGK